MSLQPQPARPTQKKLPTCARVERVGRTKLSQADYERLCAILARKPPRPWTTGKGRIPRAHDSLRALGRVFGVSRQSIYLIAKAVRAGTANRLYGVRSMALALNPQSKGYRYVKAGPPMPGTPSAPPVRQPGPSIWDAMAMWEP